MFINTLNSIPVANLTPNEVAQNSHMAEVQRHYSGLSDELRTGKVHSCRLCANVLAVCELCKATEKGTIPQLIRRGWAFDLGERGVDVCGRSHETRVDEGIQF